MQWVGNSYTFNTGMEDPEAEPVKVVVNGSEIIDIEVQRSLAFGFIALILFPAWARARAQREQPHFFLPNCHSLNTQFLHTYVYNIYTLTSSSPSTPIQTPYKTKQQQQQQKVTELRETLTMCLAAEKATKL